MLVRLVLRYHLSREPTDDEVADSHRDIVDEANDLSTREVIDALENGSLVSPLSNLGEYC